MPRTQVIIDGKPVIDMDKPAGHYVISNGKPVAAGDTAHIKTAHKQ